MNTVLRVKDLSISFGEFTAVNKISFEIKKGITTAIVGESGSGKSLTGLACLSLLPGNATVSGEVIFTDNNNSVNILSLAQQELTHIRGGKVSMVFQEPMTSLNPLMRCGEQITECLKLHNNISGTPAKEIALEWLRKTELHDPEAIYNKYPHQLSGGQKQRVMIAIAMCCEPLLIIADEPTTALDVTVQKSILRLLQRLSE